jgi:hypothetical protein
MLGGWETTASWRCGRELSASRQKFIAVRGPSRIVSTLESDTWKTLDSDCREIGRMLNGLIRTLRQNARPQ